MRVTKARNKSLEGLEGEILDETKQTFTIAMKNNKEKQILKKGCTFTINGQEVEGDELLTRPEERIKRR